MQSITLIFKPSYQLAALFFIVAAAAIVVLLLLPIVLWLKLILSVIVFLHAGYVILKFALLKWPNSISKLEVNSKGELQVYNLQSVSQSVSEQATLQLNSYVSAYLVVLNLQLQSQSTSLLITGFNADANAFRQLRVWLKWRKPN